MDQNEISTIAGKSPDGHWKTTDYQMSDQLKKLESEQAELHSATQGSRKQPSIANSRSSRRRQNEEMELENLRAKNEIEQRLQERQLELEQ